MRKNVSQKVHEKRRASLRRSERLAWWLDDAFRVPVLGKHVGIDGLIGLLPGIGDAVGAVLSTLILAEAIRLGAPARVWSRMLANIGLDFVVGLVPLFGDLFDMAWKANRRNLAVLQKWLAAEVPSHSEGVYKM